MIIILTVVKISNLTQWSAEQSELYSWREMEPSLSSQVQTSCMVHPGSYTVGFVCSIFSDASQLLRLHSVEWMCDRRIMNPKGCGRKWSWPNLRYYPAICLEGLRKTTKKLSQDWQFPGWDLNPGPPEHETGALTARPRHYHCPVAYNIHRLILALVT
jgi:hypothetical protein